MVGEALVVSSTAALFFGCYTHVCGEEGVGFGKHIEILPTVLRSDRVSSYGTGGRRSTGRLGRR